MAQIHPKFRKKINARLQYVTWLRLTHNGRRTPGSPQCSECGTFMSGKEIAEYNAGNFRPLSTVESIDQEEARILYLEATQSQ